MKKRNRTKRPIRVFFSELTQRFYATDKYRIAADGTVTATGEKFDVTNDIAAAIDFFEIEFTKVRAK